MLEREQFLLRDRQFLRLLSNHQHSQGRVTEQLSLIGILLHQSILVQRELTQLSNIVEHYPREEQRPVDMIVRSILIADVFCHPQHIAGMHHPATDKRVVYRLCRWTASDQIGMVYKQTQRDHRVVVRQKVNHRVSDFKERPFNVNGSHRDQRRHVQNTEFSLRCQVRGIELRLQCPLVHGYFRIHIDDLPNIFNRQRAVVPHHEVDAATGIRKTSAHKRLSVARRPRLQLIEDIQSSHHAHTLELCNINMHPMIHFLFLL